MIFEHSYTLKWTIETLSSGRGNSITGGTLSGETDITSKDIIEDHKQFIKDNDTDLKNIIRMSILDHPKIKNLQKEKGYLSLEINELVKNEKTGN